MSAGNGRPAARLAALLLPIALGACTASTTSTASSSGTCTQSSSVACPANATGYSCTESANPAQSDTSLDCGSGSLDANGNTDYCCIAFSSSTCAPDSTVQGCQAGSYGFSCQGSDTPGQSDSTLNCSTGTAGNNGQTLYCCQTGGAPASTCAQDGGVSCTGGATGYSCTGSDTPVQSDGSLVCSAGTPVSGAMEYCCIQYSSSACMQDSTVTCQQGAYGFSCTGTSTPQQSDSALNCSQGTAGTNGETLYCCTN